MKPEREESPLPLRATGIALGFWIAAMLILAFVVIPLAFAMCAPAPTAGSAL